MILSRQAPGARSIAAAVALTATLLSCATAHPENPALDAYPAGVIGSTDLSYYDIHGSTARELVDEMRRLGPKTATGAFFGETQSPLRWSWRLRAAGGNCAASSISVTVHSQIILPRWTPPPDAAPQLVAQWNEFLASLETHEIGHKDIAAHAARDVRAAIEGVNAPCALFASEAAHATDDIMARLRAENQLYDARTRHGATQGATFPRRLAPGGAGAPAPRDTAANR